MKQLNFRNGFRLLLLAGLLRALTVSAQIPDVNSAMIRLFGDNPAFTAQADFRVMNSNRVTWLQMPSVLASADTKLRMDIDVKLMKSSTFTPDMVIKQVGTDHVTSVLRPDKKVTYIIYSVKKSFISLPLAAEDAQAATQKLERKPLGRETIDGHACVKNFSTVKNAKGTVLMQATTWNATDLKDFPVQIEMKEAGNIIVLHLLNVNLTKPAPALFDIPAGYKDETTPPPASKPPVVKKK